MRIMSGMTEVSSLTAAARSNACPGGPELRACGGAPPRPRRGGLLGVVLNRPTPVDVGEDPGGLGGPGLPIRASSSRAAWVRWTRPSVSPSSPAGRPAMGAAGLAAGARRDRPRGPGGTAGAAGVRRGRPADLRRGTRVGDPGQLEDELTEGAWHVVESEPGDVSSPFPERLWREVLRRQRGDLAMVATYPDDLVAQLKRVSLSTLGGYEHSRARARDWYGNPRRADAADVPRRRRSRALRALRPEGQDHGERPRRHPRRGAVRQGLGAGPRSQEVSRLPHVQGDLRVHERRGDEGKGGDRKAASRRSAPARTDLFRSSRRPLGVRPRALRGPSCVGAD